MELVCLDCGRPDAQLMRDSLGGPLEVKPITLVRSALLTVFGTACAGSTRNQPFVAQSPVSWQGCYLVQWVGVDGQRVDSLELLSEAPRPAKRSSGFMEAFYYTGDSLITFPDKRLPAFSGPAWRLRGDTLSIWWGILSGWGLSARHIPSGFLGTITTYTDCCVLPFQRTYPVVGVRAACP